MDALPAYGHPASGCFVFAFIYSLDYMWCLITKKISGECL